MAKLFYFDYISVYFFTILSIDVTLNIIFILMTGDNMKKKATMAALLLFLAGCSSNMNDINIKFWEKGSTSESTDSGLSKEEDTIQDEKLVEEEEQTGFAFRQNDFTELNGNNMILNPSNVLALVNKEQSLPSDYVPSDLVIPNVGFSFTGEFERNFMRKEAAIHLEKLFNDARKYGVEVFAVSGYRSYERQDTIYSNNIKRWGEERTNTVSAVPGHSEHQTGLAMDITSHSVGLQLTQDFGEVEEGIWIKENAHKHGFIIRYLQGKEEITGYEYEPWHLRYVGVDAATYIFENGLTLEEFFYETQN